jgi:hypothetical protein
MPEDLMAIRAACHVRIGFSVAAPDDAVLVVEHHADGVLLARECRPLSKGSRTLSIKTHPDATHISCSLCSSGIPKPGVRFDLEYGDEIKPIARHFIVIGAMKAGTTTLFHMLAQHPALCQTWAEVPDLSFTKEINYFRSLYRESDTPLHYDWRFPFDPATHSWTLDVSPNYAKLRGSKTVPRRIASLGAETRIAYILREPVDRIESHIAHKLREDADFNHHTHCIRVSRYAMHLDAFTAHIPRENILLLDFKKLQRRPASVMAQLCDFLGIERRTVTANAHNRRDIRFRLDAAERAHFAAAVRGDVNRLIDEYGFEPAREWLQEPRRFLLSRLRR